MLDLHSRALSIKISPALGRQGKLIIHINDEKQCVFRVVVPESEFSLHDTRNDAGWTTEK